MRSWLIALCPASGYKIQSLSDLEIIDQTSIAANFYPLCIDVLCVSDSPGSLSLSYASWFLPGIFTQFPLVLTYYN